MTPLERVGAALSGTFADHRATGPFLALYGCRLADLTPAVYYRDPHAYASGQRAIVDRFGPDIIYGPFAAAREAEAYGAEINWTVDAPPNVRRPLRTTGDVPVLVDDAPLDFMVKAAELLIAEHGAERAVVPVLIAPIDLPALILGIDRWLDLLLFEPTGAEAYLQLAEEHFVRLAARYKEAGARIIGVPVEFANPRILTEKLIRELCLPSLERAFARSPCPIVFHHGGNRIAEHLGLYAALPNVAAFTIDEHDSPTAARAALGPERVILTGPCGPRLNRGSAERVRGYIEKLLTETRSDSRFILCSTAADIPWDTDPAIIDLLMQAARAEVFHADN